MPSGSPIQLVTVARLRKLAPRLYRASFERPFMFRSRRFSQSLALLAFLSTGCNHPTRINGGGASFIYPLMLMWTKAYDEQFHVQIDYQSTGSGNGQQQTIARTIDFGCTDVPLDDATQRKAECTSGSIVHIPLVMGAVVPIYHIDGG